MQKKINCVTIDDEPHALELLREYIARFPELHLQQEFNDAISGREYLRGGKVDLLFIDINMPDLSGLKLVSDLVDRPMIIFTTAHKKFALEGFELAAVDYLLKPISPERFEKAVNKAIDYFNYKQASAVTKPEALFVYAEYRLVRIPFPDIGYIESLEDYIRIYIEGGKSWGWG
ncbi:MAG: response regulator transcription factor [Chitinophagaceae bacterium]|nr:MAG: response regulator transcription factor [Chitinophagaceae bacterium]